MAQKRYSLYNMYCTVIADIFFDGRLQAVECGLWVFNYIVDIVLFLFALFTLSKLHINRTKVA
jgi:hypothetical protein